MGWEASPRINDVILVHNDCRTMAELVRLWFKEAHCSMVFERKHPRPLPLTGIFTPQLAVRLAGSEDKMNSAYVAASYVPPGGAKKERALQQERWEQHQQQSIRLHFSWHFQP